jgi:multidrug efflux system outer membrane protein
MPSEESQVRSQRAAVQENYEAVALDYAFARQSLAATTAKSWYPHMENAVLDHTEAFGLPS